MTHITSMPESAGDIKPTEYRADCFKCGGKQCARVDIWESSCGGYEDEKQTCENCGNIRWVDGCDA